MKKQSNVRNHGHYGKSWRSTHSSCKSNSLSSPIQEPPERNMYTITGITGKVGGTLARKLLEAGQPVRAVVRDAAKGQTWAHKRCEVAIAEMEHAKALAQAFAGSEAVFILALGIRPQTGLPRSAEGDRSSRRAESGSSSPSALPFDHRPDASENNLLTRRPMMEEELSKLSIPVTFLRRRTVCLRSGPSAPDLGMAGRQRRQRGESQRCIFLPPEETETAHLCA
jgi:uncharacterized protein YbjT (DUF2867 family)